MTVARQPLPIRSITAATSAAVLLSLAACGGGASGGDQTGPPVAGAAVLVGKVRPVAIGSTTASDAGVAATAFGLDLFDKLCTAAPHANVTLSPASAAQALGMLDAGSSGKTRDAVGKLLHLPGWGSDVVAALHTQQASLAKISQVKVSNHVFEQRGLAPTQQTLDDLRTAYDADLRQLDFADEPDATDAINSVISHDTDALIPKLFDDSLDASTRTVVADAILLDAKWQVPFPSSSPGTFHGDSGKDLTAPLMDNAEASFASRTVDGWQSVVLPYRGGQLQAVAILPPASGAAAPCAAPTTDQLTSLTSGSSDAVGVVLPKLDLSLTLPLTHTLAAMGLPLQGDYSGLGAGDNQISEVVQKVVMKVDEQGTKAAAATGIGITESARLGPHDVVTFNRPFLLVLQDTATHTPLFLARVADPTAS
jgi:serpin B